MGLVVIVSMCTIGGESSVTLPQEHIPIIRSSTLTPQPSDRIPHTILTLGETQIPTTLRHTLHITRPADPEIPARTGQPAHHRIPLTRPDRPESHRGPTPLQHDGLVLHTQECDIVVLDEAAVQLDRAAARCWAELPGAGDGTGDAGGAVRHGEVAAALVEAVDGVALAGPHHGEVVVGRVGGRVHQRGQERVQVRLVGRVRGVTLLRAPAIEEKIRGGGETNNRKSGEEGDY